MAKKPEQGSLLVHFYLIDISYDDQTKEIRVFGTTREGEPITIIVKSFLPYFYAVAKPDFDLDELFENLCNVKAEHESQEIMAVDIKMKEKIYGNKTLSAFQIFVNNSADIALLNAIIKKLPGVEFTAEYDIPTIRRFLIDNDLTPFTLCKAIGIQQSRPELNSKIVISTEKISGENQDFIENPNIIGFDIETTSRGSFPDSKEDPVIMLSFYGSNNFKKVITWKKFSNPEKHIMFVDGEYQLLEEFNNTIKSLRPHILVGFNSSEFDLPFLRDRMKKYGIKLALNSDSSDVEVKRGSSRTFGTIHIDILQFIIRTMDLRTSQLTLNAVAKELIGKSKIDGFQNPRKITDVWEIGIDEELANLSRYNLQDSLLAYEIYKELLPTQLQLVKLLNLPLYDINKMNYGMLVEWFLIKNAYGANQIIPKRPNYAELMKRQAVTYTGGYVISPTPGLYSNICVFDFRSLYPSIIASHNISPETLNCECCKNLKKNNIEELGFWFCDKKQGFISNLIKELIERRGRIKDILNKTSKTDKSYPELKARQYALKTIANSTYGYMGFPNSKWYCLECAKAITALGRKYIQMTIKEFQKAGFKVLYADTDSVFIVLENKSKEEALRFLKIVNSVLRKPMELEYESFYPSGLFLEKKGEAGGAKKRYALLTENGELVLKGVEAIRGDWSKIAKDTQRRVLEILLKDKNVDAAAKYVNEVISNVKSRKVDISDMIIQVKLTKNLNEYSSKGPHVIAGEIYSSKGYNVGRGFVVNYIISEGKGKLADKVILAEGAKPKDYDIEYYINNQIMRAVFKIFEIFGYSQEKLSAGQTTLANY